MVRDRCKPYSVEQEQCRESTASRLGTDSRRTVEPTIEPSTSASLAFRADASVAARSPRREWCNYQI
jgi:hypothetical protein